jgi:hypothetical protein
MATPNLGIQKFEISDRAHDPRPQAEQNQAGVQLREAIDDAFLIVDTAVGANSGSLGAASASLAAVTTNLAAVSGSGGLLYTPASGSHWQAPAPTSVTNALDRLAEAVFAGRSGSILV